jgi:hypothetical protein
MDGRLEDALSVVARWVEEFSETGLKELAALGIFGWQQPRRYLGRPFDRAALPRTVQPSARILTYLAEPDPGLRAELDQIATEAEAITPAEDEGYAYFDAAVMQSATSEHHEAIARRFIARYKGSSHVAHGAYSPVCTARLLGDAAAILGENEAAREHYKRARDDSTSTRIRPEWALASLGLAEVVEPGEEAQTTSTRRSTNSRRRGRDVRLHLRTNLLADAAPGCHRGQGGGRRDAQSKLQPVCLGASSRAITPRTFPGRPRTAATRRGRL